MQSGGDGIFESGQSPVRTALLPPWLRAGTDPVALATDATLDMPEKVGVYRLDSAFPPIEGGMGCVYRAVDPGLPERFVAVKVIRAVEVSQTSIDMFRREAAMGARARHSYVVEVYTAGQFQLGRLTLPFYAMEWLEDPASIMDVRVLERLGLRDRVQLFLKICAAVANAHGKGVVHGDLKPENIAVLNWDSAEPYPKIFDFGLARSIRGLRPERMPGIGWTPAYAPPEVHEAGPEWKGPDIACDVYSLGKILREMLYSPRSSVAALVDSELSSILWRATARLDGRPARYGSVNEFIDALTRWQRSPLRQAQVSWAQWASRHAVVACALLTVLIAIGSYAAGTAIELNRMPSGGGISRRVTKSTWPTVRELPDVRVVRLTDARRDEAMRLAGLSPEESQSKDAKRRLWAAVADRLRRVGPTTVVFDLFFYGETDSDPVLAESLRKLVDARIGVVLSHPDWATVHPREAPTPSGAIYGVEGLASGPATLARVADGYAAILILERTPRPASASMMLLAVASHLAPGHMPIARFGAGNNGVIELYGVSRDQPSERAMVPLLAVSGQPRQNDLRNEEHKIYPGDWVGVSMIEFASSEQYSPWTLDAADVLTRPVLDLAAELRGRIVILGDNSAGADTLAHVGRPEAHGCFAQAATIQQLLSGQVIRLAGDGVQWTLLLGSALLGVSIGAWLSGRRGHVRSYRLVPTAIWMLVVTSAGLALVAITVGLCEIAVNLTRVLCHPLIPSLAGCVGVIVAGLVLPAGSVFGSAPISTRGGSHVRNADGDRRSDFNARRRGLA